MRVEHFTRQGDGWYVSALNAPDKTLHLQSIEAALPLLVIYENVEGLVGR